MSKCHVLLFQNCPCFNVFLIYQTDINWRCRLTTWRDQHEMLLTQRCFQLVPPNWKSGKWQSWDPIWCSQADAQFAETQTCTGPLGVSTSIVGKTTFHSKSIAVLAVAKIILDLERFKTRYWEYMFMAIVMVWGAWAAKRFLVRRWFSLTDWTSICPAWQWIISKQNEQMPCVTLPELPMFQCLPNISNWHKLTM